VEHTVDITTSDRDVNINDNRKHYAVTAIVAVSIMNNVGSAYCTVLAASSLLSSSCSGNDKSSVHHNTGLAKPPTDTKHIPSAAAATAGASRSVECDEDGEARSCLQSVDAALGLYLDVNFNCRVDRTMEEQTDVVAKQQNSVVRADVSAAADRPTMQQDTHRSTTVEPTPSTSRGHPHNRSERGGAARSRQLDEDAGAEAACSLASDAALRQPRKSLPFLPRTSQYERHPLLQTRSSATGLSEFELLMLEKDLLVRRKSVETKANQHETAETAAASKARPALVPRVAQYEPHPLFVRSADSGVSELEACLSEINETKERKASMSASAAATRDQQQARGGSAVGPSAGDDCLEGPMTSTVTSMAPRQPRKLEPRTSQCERNALLEFRDESGLSELDRLLMEKTREYESRSSSAIARRCTVCGAESTVRCDCCSSATASAARTTRKSVDASVLSSHVTYSDDERVTSPTESSKSASAAAQKRVRFVQQRQKTEPEDLAMNPMLTSSADGDGAPTDGNRCASSKVETTSADSKRTKDREVKSSSATTKSVRSRNYRVESATALAGGAAADGHRKSCCIS
jgi:hypothetical protein